MLVVLEKILLLIKIKVKEMKEGVNPLAHHEPHTGRGNIARMFELSTAMATCTKPHQTIF